MAKKTAKEKASFYYGMWAATGKKKYLTLYYKWRKMIPYRRPSYLRPKLSQSQRFANAQSQLIIRPAGYKEWAKLRGEM